VATLLAAARRIEESQIQVTDLGLRRPSLDEVFLTLTAAAQEAHDHSALVPSAPASDNHHHISEVA
jgi:ABC-2 type transport system ATP-binding protein